MAQIPSNTCPPDYIKYVVIVSLTNTQTDRQTDTYFNKGTPSEYFFIILTNLQGTDGSADTQMFGLISVSMATIVAIFAPCSSTAPLDNTPPAVPE